jgi:mannose-6-phosphate isomerase-like protein (cupin superfamily)
MPDAPTVQVTHSSEAERLDLGFVGAGVPNDGDAVEGKLVVLSSSLPARTDGPPQPVHGDMAKLYHVLEGALRITMGDETFDIAAGAAFTVPAGAAHAYGNPFDEAAAFMTVMSDDQALSVLAGA